MTFFTNSDSCLFFPVSFTVSSTDFYWPFPLFLFFIFLHSSTTGARPKHFACSPRHADPYSIEFMTAILVLVSRTNFAFWPRPWLVMGPIYSFFGLCHLDPSPVCRKIQKIRRKRAIEICIGEKVNGIGKGKYEMRISVNKFTICV